MFPYDAQLATAVQAVPQSIPGVLQVMKAIDATCVDGDGLKWFNRLYLEVTQAVEDRVTAGGFNDPPWLADLDVRFAGLYFNALYAALIGAPRPGSWTAMFSRRDQAEIAQIQFALAGMNAHINHDLPYAIDATCRARNTVERRSTTITRRSTRPSMVSSTRLRSNSTSACLAIRFRPSRTWKT